MVADAGVVAGGQVFGADLARHAKQRLELNVAVAVRARNGCAAGEVLFDEGPHDALLELFLKIDDVVGEVQVLRYALCVVDVVKRATAVPGWCVALKFRQTALVPELHGQSDNRPALLEQDGCHGRRIHAA
jgi:hypothetical protein